jgi:hypothetical protein
LWCPRATKIVPALGLPPPGLLLTATGGLTRTGPSNLGGGVVPFSGGGSTRTGPGRSGGESVPFGAKLVLDGEEQTPGTSTEVGLVRQ